MKPRLCRTRLALLLGPLTLLLGPLPASRAQVVPATPGKFTTRGIGGGASTGSASVGFTAPKTQTTVRTITHVALGETRQWKSAEGKSLLGKLIAFEDLVVESKVEPGTKPAPAPPPPMPATPTVVRDGRARLLVDNKPFEVPLERLSDEDRKFVEKIRDAVAAKPGPKGAP